MTAEEEQQIRQLLLDEDFTSLQNLVNKEVNLMEIIKVSKKELQHSNFLAWLFDPNGNHNLGDFALKEFVRIYFQENSEIQYFGKKTGIRVLNFIPLDFDDLEVKREFNHIDLILISKRNRFYVVIENKILAQEGSKGGSSQLADYRKSMSKDFPDSEFEYRIFIYLSLEDQEITESERDFWLQLNYDSITKLLERIITNQSLKLTDKAKFIFEQYLQTLKSIMPMNPKDIKKIQEIYKKHQSAFDLVFEHATPTNNVIWETLNRLIKEEKTVFTSDKPSATLSFKPNFLLENISGLRKCGLISESDDLKSEVGIFQFQFTIKSMQKDGVWFRFWIGVDDEHPHAREKLFEICRRHPDIFTGVKKELNPQYHQVFKKQILSPTDIQKYEDDDAEIVKLIEERFRKVIKEDLHRIVNILDKAINPS